MTAVSASDGKIIVEVQGWDRLWAFKKRLEIPFGHITSIRSAVEERPSGIRAPGTYIPGIITAGTYHQTGKKVFWNVHNPKRAIAIDLHDERYTTLIVEVADPEATICEIQRAIASANG